MKKLLILLLIPVFFGCTSEENAGVANEKTFIRYLGTEDNNQAVLAVEDNDGYALLSNTDVVSTSGTERKIKFIHTDLFGHLQWEINYPETGKSNWRAASFIETSDSQLPNSGYLIIGDSIKSNGSTDLVLLKIDKQGTLVDSAIISAPTLGASLHGHAVMKDPSDGNYIILGNITSDPAPVRDMFIAKLNESDLSVMWSKEYGAGISTTINRLYLDTDQNLLWGGSVFIPPYDVRLVQAPMGSQSIITGNNIGTAEFDEEAKDFCRSFGGWTFIGYTNKRTELNPNGTQDIYVMKINPTSQSRPDFETAITPEGGENTQNERGVSIAATSDDGFVVLGDATTATKSEDLIIAKLNASGQVVWQAMYGGADKQEAASIRVTSDGSYLVFATTYFVNEQKLMLMKVNRNGKL
jgi:hypothetical protein